MFLFQKKKMEMVRAADALPGRYAEIATAETHFLSGIALKADVPDGFEEAMFGMGCFWGVERMFWQIDGVWKQAVPFAEFAA